MFSSKVEKVEKVKRSWPLVILLLFSVLLVIGDEAQAQNSPDPLWQASYWNNTNLSGSPVVQRQENNINYNWDTESPDPAIRDDNFSARWVGYIQFRPATYRFTAAADDGIRVWVDGDLLIDRWIDQPVQTYTADKNLSVGRHQIVVEYYERASGAIAHLWWAPAPPTDEQNWRGEYYNNISLSGEPAVVREDPAIGFNWTDVQPAPGVQSNKFSVRWRRSMYLPQGTYEFTLTVDDGARLWVNGRRLIDAWQVQSPNTYTVRTFIPEGTTPLQLDYFDNFGGAIVQLSWQRTSTTNNGWRAEYYDNPTLSGAPAVVRTVSEIDFNWGRSSPAPGAINSDRFAARWTQTLDLSPGNYRFQMTVDDGGRLWVDDYLVINAWQLQSPSTYANQIYIDDQPVSIRMEYFENVGGAVAQLSWDRVGSDPVEPTPPAVPLPTPSNPLADWRSNIPDEYHPIFQRCLQYFNQTGQVIGPSPNWDALLQQCLELTRQG